MMYVRLLKSLLVGLILVAGLMSVATGQTLCPLRHPSRPIARASHQQTNPMHTPASRPRMSNKPFWFVHLADSSGNSRLDFRDTRRSFRDASHAPSSPAFVVDTDTFAGHFDEDRKPRFPVYHVTPEDNELEPNAKGKGRYTSFNYGGCHFILADQTILHDYGGRFKTAQLAWLKRDLARIPPTMSVFLFFRAGAPCSNKREVDETFLTLLAGYNVKAMFFNEAFSDGEWEMNGIFMSGTEGLDEKNYHAVEVTSDAIRILRWKNGKLAKATDIPRQPLPKRRIDIIWQPGTDVADAVRKFTVQIVEEGRPADSRRYSIGFMVDEGTALQPVQPQDDTTVRGEIKAEKLENGVHRLRVQVTTSDRRIYKRDLFFLAEPHADQPRHAWKAPFTTKDAIRATPTLSGDTVYVASFDGSVYALNASDGTKRWQTPLGEALYAPPVVAEGCLFAGALNGRLFTLDAANGKVLWKFQASDQFYQPPSVQNGIVAFLNGNALHGLNAKTGSKEWANEIFGWARGRVATAEGTFFAGDRGGAFKAVEARTGKEKWSSQISPKPERFGYGGVNGPAEPEVGGENAFICVSEKDYSALRALSVVTGKENWRQSPEGRKPGEYSPDFDEGYSRPVYSEGRVYIGAINKNVLCYCFDAKNGTVVWRCETGLEWYPHTPAITPKYVLMGTSDGHIVWIERASGEVRYRYRVAWAGTDTPAATDTHAFFTLMDGSVYAVGLPSLR